jgi:hypothetical protein
VKVTVTYDDQFKEGARGLLDNVTLFALTDKGKEYYSFIYEATVYVTSTIGVESIKLKFTNEESLIEDIKNTLLDQSENNNKDLIAFSIDNCRVNFTLRVDSSRPFEFIDECLIIELLRQVFYLSGIEFKSCIKEDNKNSFYKINLFVSKSVLNSKVIYNIEDSIVTSNFIPADSWGIYSPDKTVGSLMSTIDRSREYNYSTLTIYLNNDISLRVTENMFGMDAIDLRQYLNSIYLKLIQKAYRLTDIDIKLFSCIVNNKNIFAIDEAEYLFSDNKVYRFEKGVWKYTEFLSSYDELEKYELSEDDVYSDRNYIFVKEHRSHYSVLLTYSNNVYSILKSKLTV